MVEVGGQRVWGGRGQGVAGPHCCGLHAGAGILGAQQPRQQLPDPNVGSSLCRFSNQTTDQTSFLSLDTGGDLTVVCFSQGSSDQTLFCRAGQVDPGSSLVCVPCAVAGCAGSTSVAP